MEIAAIIAVITCDFSCRLAHKLIGGFAATRREWELARWHLLTYGLGQRPEPDVFNIWRMKETKLRALIEFLVCDKNLQHVAYGDKNLRLNDGTELRVSAALRTRCKAALWCDYKRKHTADDGSFDGVCETEFNKACGSVAAGDLKQLGALDPVTELHGRQQFKKLREYLGDVALIAPALSSHAKSTIASMDAVETFLKRGIKDHMEKNSSSCAEHCTQCSLADSTGKDPSVPTCCGQEHSTRCRQSAAVQALPTDANALLDDLDRAVGAVGAAPSSGSAGAESASGGASGGVGASSGGTGGGAAAATPVVTGPVKAAREIRILASRALARIHHYYKHVVRGAHESHVMPELLSSLQTVSGERMFIVNCDWKMKFMMSVFREVCSRIMHHQDASTP